VTASMNERDTRTARRARSYLQARKQLRRTQQSLGRTTRTCSRATSVRSW
jgi:hypothetical protein